MIEIKTRSGAFLDIDPECSFEITFEQPLFDENGVPVPFSTPISFEDTETNCREFGYINAMAMDPEIKRLEASIFLMGIEFISGRLEYAGVEDGKLNYQFVAKGVDDDWGEPIYSQLDESLAIIHGDSATARKSRIQSICNNPENGINSPIMVVDGYQSKIGENEPWLTKYFEYVDPAVKFRNGALGGWTSPWMPVFKIKTLLQKAMKNCVIDPAIIGTYNILSIIGQYSPKSDFYDNAGWPVYKDGFDIQTTLPAITVSDLVNIVLNILCAAIYKDGDKYRIVCRQTIFDSKEAVDWSDKISDKYNMEIEGEERFGLRYTNSDTDSEHRGEDSSYAERSSYSYSGVMEEFGEATRGEPFIPVVNDSTSEVFSGKKVTYHFTSGETEFYPVCDCLVAGNLSIGDPSPDKDVVINANLVRCIPVYHYGYTVGPGPEYNPVRDDFQSMAPLIKPGAIGDPQGKDVYIGAVIRAVGETQSEMLANDSYMLEQVQPMESDWNWKPLDPGSLWRYYHRDYSRWLGKKRQIVSADVRLTVSDLATIKLDKKIYVFGRYWLIKELKVTVSAASNDVDARVQLISI